VSDYWWVLVCECINLVRFPLALIAMRRRWRTTRIPSPGLEWMSGAQAIPVALFESFGDYKLPGYIYTTSLLMHVFDPDPWVVRLPSLMAGVGIIELNLSIWEKTVVLKRDWVTSGSGGIFESLGNFL
jgi:hypothetical protein